MKNQKLTLERLKSILAYDQKTGIFRWKHASDRRPMAGEVAGTVVARGYRRISIGRIGYRAHILAWFYVYGVWPESDIDHKDRIPGHDWIDNLRLASPSQNQQNRGPSKRSGIKGASFASSRSKWRAQIFANGKYIHLGYFETKEEALQSYAAAARGPFW